MKNDLTELVFILDKSGSMSGLEQDTIGGFNSLIEKQKKEPGEAIVSTILFNDDITVIHDRVNINSISKITDKEYHVFGCTALLDAVGNTLTHIKNIQNNLDEANKPSKTLIIIITDGMENSSQEYSYSKVKGLIDELKEKNNYEFIFMGANIDSEEEASKLGIDKDKAVSYNNDSTGIEINYCALDNAIKGIRTGKRLPKEWRNSIDEDIKKRSK